MLPLEKMNSGYPQLKQDRKLVTSAYLRWYGYDSLL